MTRKLFSFELRSSFRMLLIVWAALLAMTVILCIMLSVSGLGAYEQFIQSRQALDLISSIVQVISWILYAAIFSALVVLTLAIVILRFYRGLLGEEGYLMHTLPVKEWQLITAKGITALCAVVGSILVGIISVVLLVNVGNPGAIAEGFADFFRGIRQEPLMLLLGIEFLIIAVLDLLKSIYQIYAAISIGQLANRHRVLGSLGAYIGITIALSIIAGLLFFLFTVSGAGEHIGAWINGHSIIYEDGVIENGNGIQGFGPSQLLLLFLFLVEAIQLAGFHVIAERLLSTRLNLL